MTAIIRTRGGRGPAQRQFTKLTQKRVTSGNEQFTKKRFICHQRNRSLHLGEGSKKKDKLLKKVGRNAHRSPPGEGEGAEKKTIRGSSTSEVNLLSSGKKKDECSPGSHRPS